MSRIMTMTNLPKVPNNPILADVKRRLDLGPGYIPVDMRNDIVLLMNMVIHLDHVIDQMVEDPENEEKATAAGLRILHRSFQEELRNHDNTKNELKIAKAELDNLNRWVRVSAKNLDANIDLVKRINPQELEEFFRNKLGLPTS